jgi:flagellar L-ring protein precursor FlgH
MKQHRHFSITLTLLFLAAPMALAQAKDQPTAAPRHLTSWTADRREYQVGDVITILVTDATLATATKSQNGSDQQTRKNGLDITPPKIGTTALPTLDATMSMNKTSSSAQSGDAKRNLSFRGDISVRVIAVDKTGLLQVKGLKVVDVDKNKQTLNLAGWLRPEDVAPDNTAQSDRIADAQLTYQLSGDLGKTRGGVVGRLLNVFWP